MISKRFAPSIGIIAALAATAAAVLPSACAFAQTAAEAHPLARRPLPLVTGAIKPLAPGIRLKALAGNTVIARPAPPHQKCEPHHDDVSALPITTMMTLPPQEYVTPDKPVQVGFNAARAAGHLVALEFSLLAYTDKQRPGTPVLQRRYGWQVLEHAGTALRQRELSGRSPWTEDAIERSGFKATTYVNPALKQIVIAIAGTSFRDLGDLRSDYAALRDKVLPEQFRIALAYARDVRERYGASHAITCSGHSLGGGACAYTAATLGLAAVTVNPIASLLPHPVCRHALSHIDNYVMGQDIAHVTYEKAGRRLLGNVIMMRSPWRDWLASYGSGSSLRLDKLIAKPVGWVVKAQAHRLEAALDTISRQAGLPRPSAVQTAQARQRPPAKADPDPESPRSNAAPSGICHDGKRFYACQIAGGR
jgi:hypothetical protein